MVGGRLDQRRPMVRLTAPAVARSATSRPRPRCASVLNFNGGDDVVRCVDALYAAPPTTATPRAGPSTSRSSSSTTPRPMAAPSSHGALRRPRPGAQPGQHRLPGQQPGTARPRGHPLRRPGQPGRLRRTGLARPAGAVPGRRCRVGAACPLMLFEDRFVDVEITSATSSPGGGDPASRGARQRERTGRGRATSGAACGRRRRLRSGAGPRRDVPLDRRPHRAADPCAVDRSGPGSRDLTSRSVLGERPAASAAATGDRGPGGHRGTDGLGPARRRRPSTS